MHARLFDVRNDYWVETTAGRTVFQVDGRAVRVGGTLTIRDAGGVAVATMQEPAAPTHDTVRIERPGRPAATVTRSRVTPGPDGYLVEADDVGTIDVRGDLVDHEYTFESGGRTIAEVSKRWMTVRDTFGVRVEPGADTALVLAAVVALDALAD
jgi:uncharacterized protein YxjI